MRAPSYAGSGTGDFITYRWLRKPSMWTVWSRKSAWKKKNRLRKVKANLLLQVQERASKGKKEDQ